MRLKLSRRSQLNYSTNQDCLEEVSSLIRFACKRGETIASQCSHIYAKLIDSKSTIQADDSNCNERFVDSTQIRKLFDFSLHDRLIHFSQCSFATLSISLPFNTWFIVSKLSRKEKEIFHGTRLKQIYLRSYTWKRLETTSKYFMADVTGRSQKVGSIVGKDLAFVNKKLHNI